MFNKVLSVTPIEKFLLKVEFENNVVKNYNVKNLIDNYDDFKVLEYTEGLFKLVKVDTGGYGISWNDDLDISSSELWKNGI